MKYKLLVLDVDGTLLNSEKEISKRTADGSTYCIGLRQTDIWSDAFG